MYKYLNIISERCTFPWQLLGCFIVHVDGNSYNIASNIAIEFNKLLIDI